MKVDSVSERNVYREKKSVLCTNKREREYVVNTFCMEHFVKKEANHRIGSMANQLEN